MNAYLLRASAIFLGTTSAASLFLLELPGVGFIEGYLLASVVAMLLWRAYPVRYAHLTAMVVQVCLGVLDVLFWPTFVEASMGWLGAILVSLHLLFACLHVLATTPVAKVAVR